MTHFEKVALYERLISGYQRRAAWAHAFLFCVAFELAAGRVLATRSFVLCATIAALLFLYGQNQLLTAMQLHKELRGELLADAIEK